jgi:serine/threonine protein kinase/tetratricopeptide (TPR) repeat protein
MTDLLDRLRRSLEGRYELKRELGRGGMATVFLAEDLRHSRPVAIKVMHPETAAAIGSDRFLREIEIAARLSHPHIVPLFDSGNADGLLFYVMPFVEGESLRARLAREKQLPVEEAVRLTREIAAALAYAHRFGLVHRDIKPENILLADGLARLADFGIARSSAAGATQQTTAGIVIGTLAYLSPEQASGAGDLDARSDLYSLGCVLYEMLAGQMPFTGPPEVLLHLHRNAVPRPVTELRPSVPRHVAAALAKVLSKARADRHESAVAFSDALAGSAEAVTDRRSVAVLPFLNLSADPEKEYFADGITEDVIAHLSKVGTIKVISRTSVMPFRKREQSAREIGARLAVATLLDGSIRWFGDRMRIVANLVDVDSDQPLWSETYDRDVTDIFAVQTDVALKITAALKAELSPVERSRIGREPTQDVHAYQLYLQGRQSQSRYTPESLLRALELFELAIERDPGFAMAHAALAQVQTDLAETGVRTPERMGSDGRHAAERALELDPDLGEAHAALAYVKMVNDFDWAGAEQGFRRALELSPGYADAYALYGRMCAALGRFDEAIELQRRAQELDPMTHRVDLATAFLRAGRLDDAIRTARRAVELKPGDSRAHATLGWALFLQGRRDEGLTELERAVALSPDSSLWLAQFAEASALAGRTDEARAMLVRLEDPARPEPASPYHLAYAYTGLGEADRAIDCIERAIAQHTGAAYGIRGSFLLTPLHGHPRFTALLKRLNQG